MTTSSSPSSSTVATSINPTANKAPIYTIYESILKQFPQMSLPVAAVKALSETIKTDTAGTYAELVSNLGNHGETLRLNCKNPISVRAGCDHFLRFATRTSFDGSAFEVVTEFEYCIHRSFYKFEAYKQEMIQTADSFVSMSLTRRESLAEFGLRFITDDAIILVHSYSRVVMLMLKRAALTNIRFQVLVTESRPSSHGAKAVKELKEAGIPATLILDAAVGYFMGKVNMVLVGAEGIAENGGLINQMGTYQIAVVAKAANKPFYVVTESHKFVRIFPLDQYNLTPTNPVISNFQAVPRVEKFQQQLNNTDSLEGFNDISFDYTPPAYITLLFTDLGVLTPSGASDELIKFFN